MVGELVSMRGSMSLGLCFSAIAQSVLWSARDNEQHVCMCVVAAMCARVDVCGCVWLYVVVCDRACVCFCVRMGAWLYVRMPACT